MHVYLASSGMSCPTVSQSFVSSGTSDMPRDRHRGGGGQFVDLTDRRVHHDRSLSNASCVSTRRRRQVFSGTISTMRSPVSYASCRGRRTAESPRTPAATCSSAGQRVHSGERRPHRVAESGAGGGGHHVHQLRVFDLPRRVQPPRLPQRHPRTRQLPIEVSVGASTARQNDGGHVAAAISMAGVFDVARHQHDAIERIVAQNFNQPQIR